MELWADWLAPLGTVAVMLAYEAGVLLAQRRRPHRVARSAHARLRADWFEALSRQRGSELLAVQTLRNSMMSATMIASTAAIALMGAVTLAVPSLAGAWNATAPVRSQLTPRLALELLLMAQLFAALACSAMSVRSFNHAGFVCSLPVDSEERQRWSALGVLHLRRAGMLYGWGLRHLLMVAPVVVAIVHPAWGPVAAVAVVAVLLTSFDRSG